jgi:hypothetical protein
MIITRHTTNDSRLFEKVLRKVVADCVFQKPDHNLRQQDLLIVCVSELDDADVQSGNESHVR